jgi:hypothetical protein
MALYEVRRTDEVRPGEFASALVIAGGTALARSLVVNQPGVRKSGSNVKATKLDTAKNAGVLTVYFDETDPRPEFTD